VKTAIDIAIYLLPVVAIQVVSIEQYQLQSPLEAQGDNNLTRVGCPVDDYQTIGGRFRHFSRNQWIDPCGDTTEGSH
jgi:hypothetical protein